MPHEQCSPDWADRDSLEGAVAYATRMHSGQRRGDGTRFILHPLEVASLLADHGAPDHLIAAGVLHDVLEKTDATASDLCRRFGTRVSELVLAVSEDPRIGGYSNRKAELRSKVAAAGEEALTLFAADKISKLRELGRVASTESDPNQEWLGGSSARKMLHYRASVRLLERQIPDSPLLPELRREFRSQPRSRLSRDGARFAA